MFGKYLALQMNANAEIAENCTDIVLMGIAVILICVTISTVIIYRQKIKNQAELARHALLQEERYRVATEICNDILFEYVIATDEMINAEKYCEIFGRDYEIADYAFSDNERKYIHDEDITVFSEFCNNLRSGKPMVEAEYRILDKNQDYVWCHLRGKTIFDEEGRPSKVIGKIVNIDMQKKELEKLQYKAQMDPLTNIFNKQIIEELVNETIHQAIKAKDKQLRGFFILDIDDFKNINDTYGHLAGDKIIVALIREVRMILTSQDLIGRIGGDEFVVFTSAFSVRSELEDRIHQMIQRIPRVYSIDEQDIPCTISLGIAIYQGQRTYYSNLLQKADRALYEVKEKGKDGYQIAI